MQSAHDLNVERLERMTSGLNKVDASMDSVVNDVHTIDLVFCLQICIKSLFNVLDDWTPGIVVVDKISETRCVNNCESQSDTILLDVCAD